MSRPTEDRAIVDAGLKALAFDSGPPPVWDEPAATYERASDEHGRSASPAPPTASLGDKLRLVPGHCDPTVNLYDWYVGIRGDRVESSGRSPREGQCIRAGSGRGSSRRSGPPQRSISHDAAGSLTAVRLF